MGGWKEGWGGLSRDGPSSVTALHPQQLRQSQQEMQLDGDGEPRAGSLTGEQEMKSSGPVGGGVGWGGYILNTGWVRGDSRR